jgi:hypothetical protein
MKLKYIGHGIHHGGDYEENDLLVCDVMYSDINLPTIRRNIILPE